MNVLFTEEQVQQRVKELAKAISKDFDGQPLHCIGVLKGAFVFMADLIRHLELDEITCDFLTISSYGDLTKSSGVVKLVTDLTVPIEGRNVLIIEDIVDTGLTLKYLLENLETRNPKTMKVCTFLHKQAAEQENVQVDYTGFVCPLKFVVGYGLDDAQTLRNLPFVATKEEN